MRIKIYLEELFLLEDTYDFFGYYVNWACFTVDPVLLFKMYIKTMTSQKRGTTFSTNKFWEWIVWTTHYLWYFFY